MADMNEELSNEQEDQVSGGYGHSRGFGYCPYTEDRGCRNEAVRNFDNSKEDCRDCAWRAW